MTSDFDFGDALLWYLIFLYSTVCHEAAHAWTSHRLGDDTAYQGGQVSLDPWPHIRREPFGMVIIPLIAFFSSGMMFGWASAPYDPVWAQRYPKRSALMAMAGPAANLALVLVAMLLIRVGLEWKIWEMPDYIDFTHLVGSASGEFVEWMGKLLSITFSLNLLLCFFNLLPLPPLDGSSFPLFFLNERAAEKYSAFLSNPALRIFGLLIAWRAFPYLYAPIRDIASDVLYFGAAS